ncbi:MAG TPA: oxidoreductase [Planctomycetaceae bacterium]|nr:oxidoreductase [Planctomycetaceae bacterium]
MLDGHTAFVTGGTQGVGAAIATALSRAGSNVIIHGLKADEAAQSTLQACQRSGAQASLVVEDFSSPAEQWIDRFVAQVQERCDGDLPDLLVNNAGTCCDLPFFEMKAAAYHRTMNINVMAGYFLTQAFARQWVAKQISGRVLFTGSINGQLAEPNHTAYDSSKGAVHSMVRSLCVALAPHKIRVNAIAPGLVTTPLTSPVLDGDPEFRRWMEIHTPNGSVPGADVCGPPAVFLLSDAAEHIHGQILFVDGGMSGWQQPDLPAALRSSMKPGL